MKPTNTFLIALMVTFLIFAESILANTTITGFIPNAGQFKTQHHETNTEALFVFPAKEYKLILHRNGFSHELMNYIDEENEILERSIDPIVKMSSHFVFHRVDVTFKNSSSQIKTEAKNPQKTRYHYYNTVSQKEITNIQSYEAVLYKNIYPNIDAKFMLKSKEGRWVPKYDFIVHSGGNPADIQLKYEGAEAIEITESNELIIKTSLGTITETIPLVYIQTLSGRKEIAAAYKKDKTTISFDIQESLNPKQTLTIDPDITWGSYFGDSGWDQTKGISIDQGENLLITGSTRSASGIATTGSHQDTIGASGGWDGYLAKFSGDGNLLWATYYGGTQFDWGKKVAVDMNNNIAMCGETYSNQNIASAGAHQTTQAGDNDAFLAVFNPDGTRKWGTYYGGSVNDFDGDVCFDFDGNVYLVGTTQSSSGIATSGSYQAAFAGGSDGFIAKFDPNGTRIWGTYYGGPEMDYFNAISIDNEKNLYLGGSTKSTSGVATPGAHQTTYGGGTLWDGDGLVVMMDSLNNRLWATYYGGSAGDAIEGITFDNGGNVYAVGYAESTNNIASSGSFQSTYGGGLGDAFLVKFSSSGVRNWGTYFGGTGDDKGQHLSLDAKGDVYITGYTASNSNIVTPDAHQPVFGGVKDAFLVSFSDSGNRMYGTYYGGSSDDKGFQLAASQSGTIALAGNTESSNNIATGGAFQTTYGGGFSDGFIAKFSTISNWEYTDTLSELRGDHSALKLNDGKILVAGGTAVVGGSYIYPAYTEIYDPQNETWGFTGDLTQARTSAQAVKLYDGRVLIVGGADNNTIFQNAEIYDPAAGQWTPAGNMSIERIGHQLALLPDNRVMVIAGTDGFGTLYNSCEIYDPKNNSWTATGSLNMARSIPQVAVLPDGRVLVTGGSTGGTPTESCEIWDPATETWTTTSAMSDPRQQHQMEVLNNGKVLVMGGVDMPFTLASAEIYDPATNTWSSANPMNTGRYSFTSEILFDGRVVVTGGNNIDQAEIFDPQTNNWSTINPMNQARYNHTLNLLDNGNLLATGGRLSFSTYHSTAETYDLGISNVPPEFLSEPDTNVFVDSIYSYSVEANDPDNMPVYLAVVQKPDWLNFMIDSTGYATLTGSPSQANIGSDTVVLAAFDQHKIVYQDFIIHVNEPVTIDQKVPEIISVYPNPAKDFIIIENISDTKTEIQILDLLGNNVYSNTLTGISHEIDIRNLKCGMYFIKMVSDQGTSVKKIMIQ